MDLNIITNIKMIKKKSNLIKYLLFSLLGIGIIVVLYFVKQTSNFFEEDKPLIIKTLTLPKREYALIVYYIPSNATSQSYVQLRKKYNENREEVFKNYERYQGISEYKFVNDSLLRIVILDTMSYSQRKDTVFVKY